MSEINLHPDDKVLTLFEVIKKIMMLTAVLSCFLVFFFIPMATGTFEGTSCTGGDEFGNGRNCVDASDDPLTKVVGIGGIGCMSLVLLAFWTQIFRLMIGQVKVVITPDNQITYRTSKPIKSHFKPSGSSFKPSNTSQDPGEDSGNDGETEIEEPLDWWKDNEEDPSSK